MDKQSNISQKLLKFLDKVKQNKTYGSVEIYFEAGEVTQVTQRIINKIVRVKKQNIEKGPAFSSSKKNSSNRHEPHDFNELTPDL